MRLLAFPVCIFLNVMLFGMCGYMYLLWLQYWHRLWKQKQPTEPQYEMKDFRRNEMIVDYFDEAAIPPTVRIKTMSQPRSPLAHGHSDTYRGKFLDIRLQLHRKKTVSRLRQALEREYNNMNPLIDNPYGVSFEDRKSDTQDLICDLYRKMKMIRTINKFDVTGPIQNFLPETRNLFPENTSYNSCAIVSSAGSLYESSLGEFIDEHDLILRFNNAPVAGYEKDVGSRTTVRILNSQILANSKFNFLNSPLYQNVTLLVWDPSNFTSTVQQWIENPEHDFVEPYVKYVQKYPGGNFHVLNPSVLWSLWKFIQCHTPMKIRRNPPSSGFLGIALLLPYCSTINVVEYVPTQRTTQRCHYYSEKLDPLCTYGVWHPLAAEKLIALAMNVAPDDAVFYDGFISIPGYNRLTQLYTVINILPDFRFIIASTCCLLRPVILTGKASIFISASKHNS